MSLRCTLLCIWYGIIKKTEIWDSERYIQCAIWRTVWEGRVPEIGSVDVRWGTWWLRGEKSLCFKSIEHGFDIVVDIDNLWYYISWDFILKMRLWNIILEEIWYMDTNNYSSGAVKHSLNFIREDWHEKKSIWDNRKIPRWRYS